jgi:hypothetical protein
MPLKPTFSALVRWRGPDPAVEIETRHPGFHTPEDAALFANGIAPCSPLALRLSPDATIHLVLIDGSIVAFPYDAITIYVLPPKFQTSELLQVANDTDFEPRPLSAVPSMKTAHGDYKQAQFGVLDQDDSALDVRVDWDEGDHLRVTVEESSAPPDDSTDILLGSLPEA